MRFSLTNFLLAATLVAVSIAFVVRDHQYRRSLKTCDFVWKEYVHASDCLVKVRREVIVENNAMKLNGALTNQQGRYMQWSFGVDPDNPQDE